MNTATLHELKGEDQYDILAFLSGAHSALSFDVVNDNLRCRVPRCEQKERVSVGGQQITV